MLANDFRLGGAARWTRCTAVPGVPEAPPNTTRASLGELRQQREFELLARLSERNLRAYPSCRARRPPARAAA
jgi:hypothetical protein